MKECCCLSLPPFDPDRSLGFPSICHNAFSLTKRSHRIYEKQLSFVTAATVTTESYAPAFICRQGVAGSGML
jgi:hypothetical protein